jgi:dihydrofolate synthase/folylpolyglutamate synthase
MFLGHSLDHDSLAIAVASMTSPGRLEAVARRPLVIIDGAHNRQGFEGLARSLDEEFPPLQWQLVLGVRGERKVEDLVSPLVGLIGHVFATAANDPASLDKAAVGLAASRALGVDASPITGVSAAVAEAMSAAGADGGVIVAGSLYVVGEARSLFDLVPDRGADAHLRFASEPAIDQDDEDGSAPDYYDRDDRNDRAD